MLTKRTILFSIIASLSLASPSFAAEVVAAKPEVVAAKPEVVAAKMDGRSLAIDNKKGNCFACHKIPSEPKVQSAGNIGPTLEKMKDRYPDRAILRARIWDQTAFNSETVMPPFGRNKILTEEEVDLVADYIQNLN